MVQWCVVLPQATRCRCRAWSRCRCRRRCTRAWWRRCTRRTRPCAWRRSCRCAAPPALRHTRAPRDPRDPRSASPPHDAGCLLPPYTCAYTANIRNVCPLPDFPLFLRVEHITFLSHQITFAIKHKVASGNRIQMPQFTDCVKSESRLVTVGITLKTGSVSAPHIVH